MKCDDTYTAATDPGWPPGVNHQKMKVWNLFVSIIALDSCIFPAFKPGNTPTDLFNIRLCHGTNLKVL